MIGKRAGVLTQDLLGVHSRAAVRGIHGEAELKEGGVLDQVLHPFRVVDAGKLDHQPVAAQTLTLDHRLSDAELVDAVADRLQGLVDRLLADVVHLVGPAVEDHLLAAAPPRPVRHELLEDVGEQGVLVGRQAGESEADRRFGRAGDAGGALLVQFLDQAVDVLLGFRPQRIVGQHLEHEVNAAAQVETQLDRVAERKRRKGAGADHDDHEQAAPEQIPVHDFGASARPVTAALVILTLTPSAIFTITVSGSVDTTSP